MECGLDVNRRVPAPARTIPNESQSGRQKPSSPAMQLRVPRPTLIAIPTTILLVLVGVLQVGLPLYRRHQAIATIERLGGHVGTEPKGPTWLRNLLGEERMEELFDEAVHVVVVGTITDEDLACICELTSLEIVEVDDGAEITDSGLKYLGRLRHLQSLILLETEITDAGLIHLKDLDRMEYLDLQHARITDRGLQHLKGMTRLADLCLSRTNVTDAGVAELERALPDIEIYR